MAQILKPEARDAIINSAKEEFLEKGYDDASMRSIAKKSNMTVGNLYRYFKSKEDINVFIVSETLKDIDNLVKKLTSNKLSLEMGVFDVKFNTHELLQMLDELAVELVEIYSKHKIEVNILMLKSKLNEDLIKWFSKVISDLITVHYGVDKNKEFADILSRGYAISIFDGLREIFRIANVNKEELKVIVRTFLRSYVFMLDTDIKKYVGE